MKEEETAARNEIVGPFSEKCPHFLLQQQQQEPFEVRGETVRGKRRRRRKGTQQQEWKTIEEKREENREEEEKSFNLESPFSSSQSQPKKGSFEAHPTFCLLPTPKTTAAQNILPENAKNILRMPNRGFFVSDKDRALIASIFPNRKSGSCHCRKKRASLDDDWLFGGLKKCSNYGQNNNNRRRQKRESIDSLQIGRKTHNQSRRESAGLDLIRKVLLDGMMMQEQQFWNHDGDSLVRRRRRKKRKYLPKYYRSQQQQTLVTTRNWMFFVRYNTRVGTWWSYFWVGQW